MGFNPSVIMIKKVNPMDRWAEVRRKSSYNDVKAHLQPTYTRLRRTKSKPGDESARLVINFLFFVGWASAHQNYFLIRNINGTISNPKTAGIELALHPPPPLPLVGSVTALDGATVPAKDVLKD